MAAGFVKNTADVLARRDRLKSRFAWIRRQWESLDGWRRMDPRWIEEEVWKHISQNSRRWTIMKSDIAAISATTIAFLVGDGVQITATPRDPASLFTTDNANILEGLGLSVWEYLDRDRAIPLLSQIADHAVNRGHIIIKRPWLSPSERGEVREAVQSQVRWDIPGFPELDEPYQRVTTEGAPPICFEVLDPFDCYWNLGKDDRVLEIVHEFRLTYGQLCDIYPNLADHPHFKSHATAYGYDDPLTVTDYWNEEVNAILIEDQEYKAPTQHHYGAVPFTVELVNPQLYREASQGMPQYWGTPFALPVLEHVRSLSWADSISATYMEEIAFALLQHKGISSRIGASPWIQVNPDTNLPEYIGEIDASPDARVQPMYDGESLEYLQPPRLVDMLQEFKAARQRDIQLLTYAEGILTGVYNVDISGISVSQQKQAAMARLTSYQLGIDRACSRAMTASFQTWEREWDRISPLLLDVHQGPVVAEAEISREHFAAIRKVEVKTRPKVPINPEAELSFMLNGLQFDVFTLEEVQEKAGVKNPSASIKRRAWEKMVLNNPEMQMRLAQEYMREMGFGDSQSPPQAPAPPGGALPVGTPPPAGALPPGGLGPGGPPGMGGPVPGGPPGTSIIPPEILAQLPPELAMQIQSAPPEQQMAMMQQLQQMMGGGQPALPPGPGGMI